MQWRSYGRSTNVPIAASQLCAPIRCNADRSAEDLSRIGPKRNYADIVFLKCCVEPFEGVVLVAQIGIHLCNSSMEKHNRSWSLRCASEISMFLRKAPGAAAGAEARLRSGSVLSVILVALSIESRSAIPELLLDIYAHPNMHRLVHRALCRKFGLSAITFLISLSPYQIDGHRCTPDLACALMIGERGSS